MNKNASGKQYKNKIMKRLINRKRKKKQPETNFQKPLKPSSRRLVRNYNKDKHTMQQVLTIIYIYINIEHNIDSTFF